MGWCLYLKEPFFFLLHFLVLFDTQCPLVGHPGWYHRPNDHRYKGVQPGALWCLCAAVLGNWRELVVNAALSISLEMKNSLEVPDLTSWGRHLLLFMDRECSNGDCFLELVTAVLRIMCPKSLEVMQLCFSTVNIQLRIPKTRLYKNASKIQLCFYILHLSNSFLDAVRWKLLQIPSPFVGESICWLAFLAQCSHIKHHWLQFPPEPL